MDYLCCPLPFKNKILQIKEGRSGLSSWRHSALPGRINRLRSPFRGQTETVGGAEPGKGCDILGRYSRLFAVFEALFCQMAGSSTARQRKGAIAALTIWRQKNLRYGL